MMMGQSQRTAVVAEATSWLNTPYHSHGRLKGVGVDCAMLLAEVYSAAGVVEPIDPGHYPEQFGLHRDEERFLGFVERYAIPAAAPEAGDCVLFRFGRSYSHGGILVSPTRLVHAAMREGRVVYADLTDTDLATRSPLFFTIASS